MATIDIAATTIARVRVQGLTGYQSIANGTGTRSLIDGASFFGVSMNNTVGEDFTNSDESFLSFDFSTLPAGTINSASIIVTGYFDQGGTWDGATETYFIPYDFGAGIDTTDYVSGSSANSLTKYATIPAKVGVEYQVAYSSSATSSFLTAMASRGTIKLLMISQSTIGYGLSGGYNNRADELYYGYNYSNVSYRPKITVNYTPSAPAGPTYNLIVSPR
jgi:hypothetical protein